MGITAAEIDQKMHKERMNLELRSMCLNYAASTATGVDQLIEHAAKIEAYLKGDTNESDND